MSQFFHAHVESQFKIIFVVSIYAKKNEYSVDGVCFGVIFRAYKTKLMYSQITFQGLNE